MSSRKRSEVENGLVRKGFVKSNSDHKKFIYYTFNGKKTSVWTKTSHGSGHNELSEDILRKIAKQCCLTRMDLNRLLDCPLNREDYERMLIEKGRIIVS
ncbi:hypothetical protein [Desulfurispora thermophila]|uniref:hypothetical protein n=1 Tax=Desulfurispora thermophila TaxID=265470 RepID=UPI0003612858|nr:hypothetical protein [Desulfurispora thermophila]